MAERILIRPESGAPNLYRWLRLNAEPCGEQLGDLDALASAAVGLDAVLLLPAPMVWLTELELPVKNPGQIKQALPFALEDRLADDVENYHLTWFRQANRKLAVAAVAKQALADCLQPLRQAGINLVAAYPEALCLPWQAGECSVLMAAGEATFRHGPWLGGGIDDGGLPLVLDALRLEAADFGALRIFGKADLAAWAEEMNWGYSEQPVDATLPWLAGQLDAVNGLNVLSGPYANKPTTAGESKRWLPAVGLLVLALAVQLAGQIYLNRQSRQQIAELDLQTQALFQRTFPEVKRIVNVRVQAEQALREIRQRRDDSDQFLRLLYAVGERLGERPDLALSELSFAGDSLQLRLPAVDSSALDAVLSGLRDEWAVGMELTNDPARGEEVRIDVRPR